MRSPGLGVHNLPSPKENYMKQKTKQDFIKWIEEQVEYYKPFLGIELQKIKIKEEKDLEYLAIACVYPYLEPYIKFGDKAFKAFQEGYFTKDKILHELLHIITDPLYKKALTRFVGEREIEDERERLTDTLTVIIRNLIENNNEQRSKKSASISRTARS